VDHANPDQTSILIVLGETHSTGQDDQSVERGCQQADNSGGLKRFIVRQIALTDDDIEQFLTTVLNSAPK